MSFNEPDRIQRRRAKGWRKPAGAVIVDRTSQWGNPFRVGVTTPADWHEPFAAVSVCDRGHAVRLLRLFLRWRRDQGPNWHSTTGPHFPWESQIRASLRGRDLVCWCPPSVACHADVLLSIANEPDNKEGTR